VIDPAALRRIRTDRGLSQRRVAEAIGVDPLTVKRIEGGADAGDLPLRVLEQLAGCLAIPVQDLLRTRTAAATGDLVQAVGAALLAHGRTTITRLAGALSAPVHDVATAFTVLDAHVAAAGMSVARHHDEIWLVPLVDTEKTAPADRPLTLAEARLLRRIHRGEDVRRKLSRPDREIILPALQRRGLVVDLGNGPCPATHVAESLTGWSMA
jgi:transcriptional regulator with XRE-family HTH domain